MTKLKTPLTCLVLLAVCLCLTLAFWNSPARAVVWNTPASPVTPQVALASGAAQSNAATLTGSSGRMTYLEGFDLTGGGATAASVIEVSITGLTTTLKFEVAIQAGVTAPAFGTSSTNSASIYSVRFPTPIPASATNTNIVVTCPSFGAGNTNASVIAYGFTQ
jgi:hypothetical protein